MLHGKEAPASQVVFDENLRAVRIRIGQDGLNVSLGCPQFFFEGFDFEACSVSARPDGHSEGENSYITEYRIESPDTAAGMDVEVYAQWSLEEGVLRKWARFRIDSPLAGCLWQETVLERYEINEGNPVQFQPHPVQSQPAFFRGWFIGIEFPVASTRVESGTLLLAHKPGLKLAPDVWYETRKAVYGISGVGGEKEAFQTYLRRHSQIPGHFHINYNSWYTSPVPYAREDIVRIMRRFRDELHDAQGESFDTFCIDMGWSDRHSIWEINKNMFPEGFAELEQEATRMNSDLGLWISPTACYSDALDNDWAKEQGYGTSSTPWAGGHTIRFICLASDKYQKAFKNRIVSLVQQYPIRHIKLDGCMLECKEEDHDHEPGPYASEKIAEGMIDVLQSIHQAVPDVWLETTCFGWHPSPWWLWYANSVLGAHGDDVPYGRVPAPVYRESYTSARDFFNLQGTARSVIPPVCQEVLGIVHQTQDCFMNDAIMTVMRGHMFLPVYLNPEFMTDARWEKFAGLLKWARANAAALLHASPLLPASWSDGRLRDVSNEAMMPREPYGYAHWNKDDGLVILRNPWIMPGSYVLRLPERSDRSGKFNVVSLYPEVRQYGKDVRGGDAIDIRLAPYETVVLSVIPAEQAIDVPEAAGNYAGKPYIQARILNDRKTSDSRQLEADIEINAPQAELLILVEGNNSNPVPVPDYQVRVNGNEAEVKWETSAEGWAHSWISKAEDDWLFMRIPLTQGGNRIDLELTVDPSVSSWSSWVWATKPGDGKPASYPNVLPLPEIISLDAISL
ncbi:alpha-galactosidase [Cohnella silvisoli]|uniref:Alpha-galactosidase n=1 Tax=Cohnella silvisoli TaxID=2873699 RepID=A0ABV1KMH5_9BACL|nr:alpha-galactosidase [Cohnella silvisoli]MCD9020375.1 alpha-galactosidase [Cohnella silvisoli]